MLDLGMSMSPIAMEACRHALQGGARLHQLVGKDHRVAQTATAERLVDQARDFLLRGRFSTEKGRPLGRISDRREKISKMLLTTVTL